MNGAYLSRYLSFLQAFMYWNYRPVHPILGVCFGLLFEDDFLRGFVYLNGDESHRILVS